MALELAKSFLQQKVVGVGQDLLLQQQNLSKMESRCMALEMESRSMATQLKQQNLLFQQVPSSLLAVVNNANAMW